MYIALKVSIQPMENIQLVLIGQNDLILVAKSKSNVLSTYNWSQSNTELNSSIIILLWILDDLLLSTLDDLSYLFCLFHYIMIAEWCFLSRKKQVRFPSVWYWIWTGFVRNVNKSRLGVLSLLDTLNEKCLENKTLSKYISKYSFSPIFCPNHIYNYWNKCLYVGSISVVHLITLSVILLNWAISKWPHFNSICPQLHWQDF